jgi:tRNA dimethylallyltransferase
LWALVGPTAAGKSALALALAQRLGGEIISADAVQVYAHCTIGSAKPTAAEQALVPHHLIDVAHPAAPFDASQFVRLAQQAIADVRARGRVPILCGGTGLYLRALRLGLIEVPKDAALRAELEAADAQRPGASLERLRALDPASAQSIHPSNGHYVRRALEITLLMGRPASAVRAEHGARPAILPMELFWVDRPDAQLRQRIAARTGHMLEAGWVDEVRRLLEMGLSPASQALRSVGYREVVAMLSGQLAPQHLPAAVAKSTWGYVRRQRIWLRREQRAEPALVQLLPAHEDTEALASRLTQRWRQWAERR